MAYMDEARTKRHLALLAIVSALLYVFVGTKGEYGFAVAFVAAVVVGGLIGAYRMQAGEI